MENPTGLRFSSNHIDRRLAVERLTALWALNEAGLGGIMHAFRTPFTGIFVGGLAIVMITLIAHFSERKWSAVTRALVIVLIVKAAASPHSPLPAYLAVSFQGLMGALIFSALPNLRLGALLLGVLGLLEAAVQKLLVMTILFGNPLWESIDAFFNYVFQQMGFIAAGDDLKGSWWIIGAYLGLYLAAGAAVGLFAGRLPAQLQETLRNTRLPDLERDAPAGKDAGKRRRRKWLLPGMLLLGMLLITVFLQPSGSASPLWLILRVALILGAWYFFLAPLLMAFTRRFLRRKHAQYQREVERSLALLPVLRKIARAAWKETAAHKGWRRLREFLLCLIAYSLLYEEPGMDDEGKKSD
jgi:hypothetical protein